MSTVVCHLFVVPVPVRSAVCSQALCVVSGEASSNFNERHGVISLLILADKPFSFSYLQGFCNGVFLFKIAHKLTSSEARKVGLVTVVSLGMP